MTVAAPPAPVADWIDPAGLVVDPYPTYERLRAETPVAFIPFMNAYVAATYEECTSIEANPQIFTADAPNGLRRGIGHQSMIDTDDPEHAEIRRPVNLGMRPKMIKERWTETFEANARFYLDRLADVGPDRADLNKDVAAPLATQNLMDLLGLRDVGVDVVRDWSSKLMLGAANVGNDPEIWKQVDGVGAEMDSLLDEIIPYLRDHPDGTFTSALISAGLPDVVVAANVKLAISGGINEPQHAVTSIVWTLTEHPEQRDEILANPELWSDAFDETLRWRSPLHIIPRLVLEDAELRGVTVPAGSTVAALIASANRDATIFERPDEFDIHRAKVGHLAFGSGVHICAGMWAARWSIGSIAVPMLYRRFDGLRTAEDRESLWIGFAARGLQDHAVTWDRDRGNSPA